MKKDKKDESPQQSNLNNFEAQFKRSTTPLLVLELLSEREMYAYEIIQETLIRSNQQYRMPLLYTILNKMQDQGYVVESRKEISEDNRVRNYYAITPEGRIYLSELKKLYGALTESVIKILKET
ncbi:PadR family transcriptional regulator [Anaerovorax odorimutans]|uniref:PadR family transcriptional regulator n=1 Tax=Anaerovorax odorimutans TaxID=109327 RepID=A0ABT1RTD4_9FIRM|nr:PadR family transcriptional regulator [Anaerovorax odorimutans]